MEDLRLEDQVIERYDDLEISRFPDEQKISTISKFIFHFHSNILNIHH